MRIFSLLLTVAFVCCPLVALAQTDDLPKPELRGFGAPLSELTVDRADTLSMDSDNIASHWNVNALVHHVGNDAEQDDITTVSAYREMMESGVQLFEDKLEVLCPRDIKMVFSLYSVLGGFETRGEDGRLPNDNIAVSELAQTEFVNYWGVLAERLAANDNIDCVAGLNLKNEPQFNTVGAGLKEWPELAPLAIAAIREHLPTIRIIVPSEGADPKKLKQLPDSIADDANTCYGIHAYPFLSYQHSGIGSDPTNTPAPSNKKIKVKFWKSLGAFQARLEKRKKKEKIQNIPPICITEWAVPRSAQDADVFLDRFISSFENENDDAGRGVNAKIPKKSKCKRKGPKKSAARKRCLSNRKSIEAIPRVDVMMWYNHAIYEARVWDPRYLPGEEDSFVELPTLTDRGEVIHRYLQYNLDN